MSMADGRGRLQKIAFQIGDRWFRFAINPENYTHRKPHRTTAIKTKSRVVIEDFQSDIPVITIRGTTGFNPTGVNKDRGINKIKEMKRFLDGYAKTGGNGSTTSQDFYFHNFTNGESFVVHFASEGVNYIQDVESPLTYKYEITFTVLRKAGEPSEDSIADPEIGNRFPSIPTGKGAPSNPYPSGAIRDYEYNTRNQRNSDIYGSSMQSPYQPTNSAIEPARLYSMDNPEPVNPQAPSVMSYNYGVTGLGYTIGYYGRGS